MYVLTGAAGRSTECAASLAMSRMVDRSCGAGTSNSAVRISIHRATRFACSSFTRSHLAHLAFLDCHPLRSAVRSTVRPAPQSAPWHARDLQGYLHPEG